MRRKKMTFTTTLYVAADSPTSPKEIEHRMANVLTSVAKGLSHGDEGLHYAVVTYDHTDESIDR